MKRNIVTQRLAMVMATALAVGLLATDAQARGGGMGGGAHFGGGFAAGGFHGDMMTGRSAFVPGVARMGSGFGGEFHGNHRHAFIGCCSPSYSFESQNGCC